jgi:hypothetical protein
LDFSKLHLTPANHVKVAKLVRSKAATLEDPERAMYLQKPRTEWGRRQIARCSPRRRPKRCVGASMTVSAVSPCRIAFRRDRLSPSSVKGPVLSCALRRLASICRSDVIRLPASNWFRFVILTAGRGVIRSEQGTIHCPIKLVRAARAHPNFMCFLPECSSDAERLDRVAVPPSAFLAVPMQFAVMESTNGHREFVADYRDRSSIRSVLLQIMQQFAELHHRLAFGNSCEGSQNLSIRSTSRPAGNASARKGTAAAFVIT